MVSVSEAGLKDCLADHRTWLETNGAAGQRADLSGRSDLRAVDFADTRVERASFASADLTQAHFDRAAAQGADFGGARLVQARFCGTDLRGARLRGADATLAAFCVDAGYADLRGADLRDATLTGADLSRVEGLSAAALGGADLALARLPADIAEFPGLDHVARICHHARITFLLIIAACLCVWLTVAATTDFALVLNAPSALLPFIQTAVPPAGVYWAAPVLLLALYIYFHIYLQRLWEALAALPARFPDGRPLDERVAPWLLVGLVRRFVPRLQDRRPPWSAVQSGLSVLFAWGLVPLTLGVLWSRYLPRHDWGGTALQVVALAIAVGFAVVSWRLMKRTLRKPDPLDGSLPGGGAPFQSPAVGVGGGWHGARAPMAVTLAMLAVSALAIEMPSTGIGVVDSMLLQVGAPADLFARDIAEKPAAWVRGRADNVLPTRIRLTKAHLRHANAERAFLANADLRWANLSNANLARADLQGADLRGAWMLGADLEKASLVGANLWLANARFGNLAGVDLSGAYLSGASIGSTDLENAKLIGARMPDAGIRGVRAVNADMTGAQLQGADFSDSDLTGARLVDATLSGAIFYGAVLTDTNIEGADLTKANIAQRQLDQACGIRPPRFAPDSPLRFTPRPCPSAVGS